MNYSPSPHQTELHRPHAFFTQDHFRCLLVGLPQNPEKKFSKQTHFKKWATNFPI